MVRAMCRTAILYLMNSQQHYPNGIITIQIVVKSSDPTQIAFRCNRLNHHRLVRASVALRILQLQLISRRHSKDHNTINNSNDLALVSFAKKINLEKKNNHNHHTKKKITKSLRTENINKQLGKNDKTLHNFYADNN